MARPQGVPCTVTYDDSFKKQAAEIEPDYRRLDKIMHGAEWVIARTELRGEVVVILNPGERLERLKVKATIGEEIAIVHGIERAGY